MAPLPDRRPAAPPAGDDWDSPSRVSGVVLVRRPAPAPVRPAARPLAPIALAVFAAGFGAGFIIGRATAPAPAAPHVVARALVAAPPVARVVAVPPARAVAPPAVAPTAPPVAAPLAPPAPEAPATPPLTAAQIVATQRAHFGRARDCVNRARRAHPDLAGRARVAVIIAPDGRVRDAVWTRAEPSQVRAVACIADAVRRWRFPPTGYAGDFIAELPFDLATGARPSP
ncbi:MAG: AgmX/PglI C-terminal domain-containing protein [Polyangiales bacterium]